MALRVYTLANCDRCRAATKWLRAHGISFEEIAIRESPPTKAELARMHRAVGGDTRRLFNTSGKEYRERKLGESLDTLGIDDAFALLAGNGNLVKRPFAIGPDVAVVGFEEAAWAQVFRRS